MGRNVRTRKKLKSDYEEALRNASLLENKVPQLREASSVQTVYGLTPLRRSQRINPVSDTDTAAAAVTDDQLQPRRSQRLDTISSNSVITKQEKVATNEEGQEEKRSANTTLKVEEKTPAKCDYEALRDAHLLENCDDLLLFMTKKVATNEVEQEEKKSANTTLKVEEKTPAKPDYEALKDPRLLENCDGLLLFMTEKVATNEGEQEEKKSANSTLKVEEKTPAKSDYEALREARLLQNKARLESLGVLNKVCQLREASAQTKKTRPYHKRVCGLTPIRRSQRINPITATSSTADQLQPQQEKQEKKRSANTTLEVDKKRPANAPIVELDAIDLLITAESSARRCNSKGRGSVYNGILGICCHFCRQKKLCGEEDCKRCGNCDVDEPCLGKTDCSVCHSSNGVFCRACLKVRYGEEIEEVRENKGWMCPHCIEEKGINPYWICNSSICLRKRNMSPTGLAIYKAREMGHKSVAHLLMEELKLGLRQKR